MCPVRTSPTAEEKAVGPAGPQGLTGPEGPVGKEGPSGTPPGGAENEILTWQEAGKATWSKITDAMGAVLKTGIQSIAGEKTFTSNVIFTAVVKVQELVVIGTAFIKVIKELELLEVSGNPGVLTARRFQAIKEAAREFGAGAIAITTAEDCFLNLKPTAEGAEVTRVQFNSAAPKVGELLFIFNNSANKLTIVHATAEAGSGKFELVGLANFVIPPKGVKMFIYTERWRDFS